MRKDLEKTKGKLKETESKLRNTIQEKKKLEGEKASDEREMKKLHAQKIILERDISKQGQISERRRDSMVNSRSSIFHSKRPNGLSIARDQIKQAKRRDTWCPGKLSRKTVREKMSMNMLELTENMEKMEVQTSSKFGKMEAESSSKFEEVNQRFVNLERDVDEMKRRFANRDEVDPNRGKRIFVGGLPHHLTDEKFIQYFQKYGHVIKAGIRRNRDTNTSRGFGYVNFDTKDAVDRVLLEGTNHKIDNTNVDVKIAVDKDKLQGDNGDLRHTRDSFGVNPNTGGMGGMGPQYAFTAPPFSSPCAPGYSYGMNEFGSCNGVFGWPGGGYVYPSNVVWGTQNPSGYGPNIQWNAQGSGGQWHAQGSGGDESSGQWNAQGSGDTSGYETQRY